MAASGERSRFFMTDLNKPQLVLVRSKALKDSVDAITGKAKDGIHAPVNQSLDEQVRHCFRHWNTPDQGKQLAHDVACLGPCKRRYKTLRNAVRSFFSCSWSRSSKIRLNNSTVS